MNPVNHVEETSVFRSRQWLFVLARVYLGISFFFSDHGNARPNELTGFLKFALKSGYSWYQGLVNFVVVPHSATFGTLIVVAEIYVGIALVIGFTTRLAICVALFLLVNYMCAKGAVPWGPGIDQSDIVLAFIILFSDAGRILGIDKLLADRFPNLWIL
ncbi:MAG: thiosulfate dehydrogenase (quinone) large subunit [Verrucomicrobiota bacterium]